MEWPFDSSEEEMRLREGHRNDPKFWTASSRGGVVVTAHYHATAAGVDVLDRGGNAIDAAVAASMALAVCESAGSGLGGMAMMMIHHARTGRTVLLEGACRAPMLASPELVAESHRYRGYRAIAVPMHVSVLRHALSNYGSLSPRDVLAEAIRLCEEGFLISALQHRNMTQYERAIQSRSGAQFFLDTDGRAWSGGHRFCQPVLGQTLRRLAEDGLQDFYVGRIAREIAADMSKEGGWVTEKDLEAALETTVSPPVVLENGNERVCTAGPPAGGLTLLQMIQIASHYRTRFQDRLSALDQRTSNGMTRVAKIIRRARADRRTFRTLYGVALRNALLDDQRISQWVDEEGSDGQGHGETSHLSIMDSEGNAVGLTQSIERCFGSAEATPSLGFLYNGYLRGFKVQNKQHPHYLKGGALARSNASPTIILTDGCPRLVIGSTGSERMNSGIFSVLLRLEHEAPFEAVIAPRIHCTPEGEVLLEKERVPLDCRRSLVESGLSLTDVGPYSFKMGGLQLALRRGAEFVGVGDPRRDSAAAGAGERRSP